MSSARPIATTRSTAGIPTGRLAVWWLIASEIVIFGGLLGSYIMFRLSHDSFATQAASTNTMIGAFNTARRQPTCSGARSASAASSCW
jgi:heme/copper-type cytochrome/quinol oxidase subunit 3